MAEELKDGYPPLPEPALKGDDGVCCGNYTTGAEYMGQRETLCCGNPDGAYPDSFTAAQMRAYVDADRAMRDGQLESLRATAQAVVDRWHTPAWKDAPATAEFINRLAAALAATPPQENES